MPDVVIVNSGVANLASITSAFSRLGASAVVTDDAAVVAAARRVVLPGVGAFGAGLAALRARRLDSAITDAVARGTPLLGVCLGMQMLCEGSEETSAVAGLGVIAGACRRLPDHVRVPHLGWNAVTAVAQGAGPHPRVPVSPGAVRRLRGGVAGALARRGNGRPVRYGGRGSGARALAARRALPRREGRSGRKGGAVPAPAGRG